MRGLCGKITWDEEREELHLGRKSGKALRGLCCLAYGPAEVQKGSPGGVNLPGDGTAEA